MERSVSRRAVIRSGLAAGLGAAVVRPEWLAPKVDRDEELQGILAELLAKHRIPGAVVGLYRDGRITTAGAGIANLNTRLPMTAETAFLTGSITKVWTASLLMTFVDEGTIQLDRPIVEYLPHFRLADMDVARAITGLHLLNHSSGIDAGDYLLELGEGPAAHRRYVEALANVGQIHRPGAYSSYCNGGFILAGHLMEVVGGASWGTLLRRRLVQPLGLERTITDTDDAILGPTAIGSVPAPGPGGDHVATSKFLLPKSAAPAGSVLITTVRENLEFAAMHLRRGRSRTGGEVLTEASARAMGTRTIGRPVGSGGFGLGWGVSGRPGAVRLSHSGGSNGGIAQLVALPDRNVAYAAFANSSRSYGFHGDLQRRIMALALPDQPGGPAVAARDPSRPNPVPGFDPRSLVGSYRRRTQVTTIRETDGRLFAEVEMVAGESDWSEAYMSGQQRSFEVVPSSATELISVDPVLLGQQATFAFLEPGGGRFDLLYSAGRLSRRVADR